MHAGACSEAERDRIEEQVGLFVRTCNANIVRLEASIQQQQQQQGGRQLGAAPALNPHVTAHRHGIVRAPAPIMCSLNAAISCYHAERQGILLIGPLNSSLCDNLFAVCLTTITSEEAIQGNWRCMVIPEKAVSYGGWFLAYPESWRGGVRRRSS